MEFITLPHTDLRCSRIALGTWSIGGFGWGGMDEAASIRTIHAALDLGVNLFDTAPIYGKGAAEEVLAKALDGGRRQRALIATKCGLDFSRSDGIFTDSRREVILREVEDSLCRLRTDVIDLYQVHWPDPLIPAEETGAIFRDLQKQGKIRAIGVSNFSPAEMGSFQKSVKLSSNQPPYSLLERGVEREVLPYCREHGIPVIAYGPLCRGMLSGRMTADTNFSSDDIRSVDPKFQPPRYSQYLQAVARLDKFAQASHGKRVIDLALRWMLEQPGVGIVLWGGRKPEQLAPVPGAWEWRLTAADCKEVDRILAETIFDPVGPEFLTPQVRAAADAG
jgi:aryl-alcohol dehydrogenase-like predicted oxidoreductase